MQWLQSRPLEWNFHPAQAGVESVRRQLLCALDDCDGFEVDRLRWRLHTAESGQDLWLLRSSVFQVIASQHCQAQASERMTGLAPAFAAVLPSRLVGRA